MERHTFVEVYVDGEAVRVPETVRNHDTAIDALMVPPGKAVALEAEPHTLLWFGGGYTFTDGERFLTADVTLAGYDADDDAQPWKGEGG